jgi:hypothetical protein
VGCCLDLAGLFPWRYWVGPTRLSIELGTTSLPSVLAPLMVISACGTWRRCGRLLTTTVSGGGHRGGSHVILECSRLMELTVVVAFRGQLHRRPGVAV